MAGFKKNKGAPPKQVQSYGDVQTTLEDLTSVVNSHADELDKLNGGLTLAANTPGFIKALSFAMPAEPPWVALTPGASWAAGTGLEPQILMQPGGLTTVRGWFTPSGGIPIAPSGAPTGSAILSTLPLGFRPSRQMIMASIGKLKAVISWAGIYVDSAGLLAFISSGLATVDAVSIDSLEWFSVAAAPPGQFSGPGWPLRVRHGFPKCNGLVVLGFRLQGQSGQNAGAGAPVVDWQDLGDGTLRINGVWGLQWGQRYDMRLYLSPEDRTEAAP